jgi:hypothetical protein
MQTMHVIYRHEKILIWFCVHFVHTAVTWQTNKQSVVVLSTTQAEYISSYWRGQISHMIEGMIGEMGITPHIESLARIQYRIITSRTRYIKYYNNCLGLQALHNWMK